jgi:hypothetical protein
MAAEFFRTLSRRSEILAITGWINLVLLAGMLAVLPFDSRLVKGINPWIKPSKFAISIIIYVWTVAWLLEYLRISSRTKRIVSWGIAISMLVEIACIVMQAARGTTSHFNVSTPFDGVIFSVMGLMIVLNSVMALVMLILFFSRQSELSQPYLWGIRSGLVIFLMASAIGGVMVAHLSHSVGVPDGGPGLPIVNWSTLGGDLRVAHFAGLHALQILPILGFLIGRHRGWTMQWKSASILAIAGAYALVVGLLYLQASSGSPLLGSDEGRLDHYSQSKVGRKRLEIPVTVQQVIPIFDTTCGDYRIDRLSNHHAQFVERTKMLRRQDRYFLATQLHYSQRTQHFPDGFERSFVAEPLQDLGQNQVTDVQGLLAE